MSGNRDWQNLNPSWFRDATESELREFVRALDENEIPEGIKRNELEAAFNKECNRRSGAYYESLNDGEWI